MRSALGNKNNWSYPKKANLSHLQPARFLFISMNSFHHVCFRHSVISIKFFLTTSHNGHKTKGLDVYSLDLKKIKQNFADDSAPAC